MSEKRVRVLVANGPRLMRELVLAILADQSDIEVTGEIEDESNLPMAIEQQHPDVLIVALNEHEPHSSQYRLLVGRHPQMKILALAPEQNRGLSYYWATVEVRTKAVESSEAGLLTALRERPSDAGYPAS
jgi:chemotaxis response regulator CheB